MKIIKLNLTSDDIKPITPYTLCLGFFDGLHLGHQTLIHEAEKLGLPVGIMTISDPEGYLGSRRQQLLTSVENRAELAESLGVQYLFVIDFDEDTRNTDPNTFVKRAIIDTGAKNVVCGRDFRFGKAAKGNIELLQDKYADYFSTIVVPPLCDRHGQKIASSVIRAELINGHIKEANQLLGRSYFVDGRVDHGYGNGHKFGFPTANINLLAPYVLPKCGVYYVMAEIAHHLYYGAANIGTHPTIMEVEKPLLEVNLLDFSGSLYGDHIRVYFLAFMRDEIRFASIEELKQAMAEDIRHVNDLKHIVSLEKIGGE